MRKGFGVVLAVLMLAGCESPVPDSAAGVGFGDYTTYLRNREAELRGQRAAAAQAATPIVPPAAAPEGGGYGTSGYGATPVTSSAGMAAQTDAPASGGIGADTLAVLRDTAPAGDTIASNAAPAATAGAPLDAVGLSTAPVASAAPVAQAPSGNAGPNLAAYALSATNAPGQAVYDRGGLRLSSSDRSCRKYSSPDLAQMAFLKKGGPQKDPENLDPDGDGFACGWDPRPFQMARP